MNFHTFFVVKMQKIFIEIMVLVTIQEKMVHQEQIQEMNDQIFYLKYIMVSEIEGILFVDTSDFLEFNENQINNRTNSPLPIVINNNVPSVPASLQLTKLKWIKAIDECEDAV